MLTIEQQQKAADMRIKGDTWQVIADEFGESVSNIQKQVKETILESSAIFTANIEFALALDLSRLEQMIKENLRRAAEEGSEKHVNAVIRIIRAKMDMLKFIMEIQLARKEQEGAWDDTTITRDSEEYNRAVQVITERKWEGLYEEGDDDEIAPTADTSDLSREDMDSLHSQLVDLELAYETLYGKKSTQG